jgi:molybdopterin synthase catalytic subunit
MDLPEGARIEDVMARLCAEHPRLARYQPHALYAMDGAFVPITTRVTGREIAVMPPVSGGAGAFPGEDPRREAREDPWEQAVDSAEATAALQYGPFSLDALVAELEKAGAGAVVGFLGYVRGDDGTERLRFEAYAPMAEAAIETLVGEARAKFGLTGCLVRHRIATLAVGEPIVAVVTAAPHRRAAFEAAQWIMDELKTRVPIWKAEEGAHGARWVNDPTR